MKVKCPSCGFKAEVVNGKCQICDLPIESTVSKPINKIIYIITIPIILAVIAIAISYRYWSNPSISQTGKDTYKALKNVEAQTTSGVNFQNYSIAVSNAVLELEMYTTEKGRKNKIFLHHLEKALAAYQYSKEIWNEDLKNIYNDSIDGSLLKTFLTKEELNEYAKLFPALYEAEKYDIERLIRHSEDNQSRFNRISKVLLKNIDSDQYSRLIRDNARSTLWNEASKELTKARSLIN